MAKLTEAERWAQADRLANGIIDDAWRRRRRRFWLVLIVSGAIAGAIAGIAGVIVAAGDGSGAHHRPQHEEPPLWRELGGFGLILLGLAVLVIGLLRMRRTHTTGFNSPLWALKVRERRQALKAIRGKASVLPAHLTVLRAAATLIVGQAESAVFLNSGLVLLAVGQLVSRGPSRFAFVYATFIALAAPLAVVVQRRNSRSARAFLVANPPVPQTE